MFLDWLKSIKSQEKRVMVEIIISLIIFYIGSLVIGLADNSYAKVHQRGKVRGLNEQTK